MRKVVATLNLVIKIHQDFFVKVYYGLQDYRTIRPIHFQVLHPRESKSLVCAQKERKKTTILLKVFLYYLKILFRTLTTHNAGMKPMNILTPALSGTPNFRHNAMSVNPNEHPKINDIKVFLTSKFIFHSLDFIQIYKTL